jgi:hypothetical protein
MGRCHDSLLSKHCNRYVNTDFLIAIERLTRLLARDEQVDLPLDSMYPISLDELLI